MGIIERFNRGEISIVELMERLGQGRFSQGRDRRKRQLPGEDVPRRRSTDRRDDAAEKPAADPADEMSGALPANDPGYVSGLGWPTPSGSRTQRI